MHFGYFAQCFLCCFFPFYLNISRPGLQYILIIFFIALVTLCNALIFDFGLLGYILLSYAPKMDSCPALVRRCPCYFKLTLAGAFLSVMPRHRSGSSPDLFACCRVAPILPGQIMGAPAAVWLRSAPAGSRSAGLAALGSVCSCSRSALRRGCPCDLLRYPLARLSRYNFPALKCPMCSCVVPICAGTRSMCRCRFSWLSFWRPNTSRLYFPALCF